VDAWALTIAAPGSQPPINIADGTNSGTSSATVAASSGAARRISFGSNLRQSSRVCAQPSMEVANRCSTTTVSCE
jgi:hypothetical protein